MVFFVHPIIAFTFFAFLAEQLGRHLIHYLVKLDVVICLAGNNQRRTGFVNQNGVHFVHYGKVQLPLYFVVLVGNHIVAQVIEAEFIVCAVGNIGSIRILTVERLKIADNHAYLQAEEVIQRLHHGRITLGQVVVDGNDVYAVAGQGIEVYGQGGYQRFSLTGTHFCDFAVVQHHAADQLDIEVAHTQNAFGCFAADGKRFRQNAVQIGSVSDALFEFCCFGL